MSVQTAVCKTIQSLGLTTRKEHQIENTIVIQLESSGPEFVLSRISALRDWRKQHMAGNVSYHHPWFKFRSINGVCVPKDKLGSQIWNLSNKAFWLVTGAIQKSFEFKEPTEKQILKWVEAVRCENRSSDEGDFNYCRIVPYGTHILQEIEDHLREIWTNRPWFSPSDVTGTNIPGSGKFTMVKLLDNKYKDPSSLIGAYGFSIHTAPLFCWKFLEDIDAPTLMSRDYDNPELLRDTLTGFIDERLSDYVLEDEAINGSGMPVSEDRFHRARLFTDYRMGFSHTVGNIGFLQQGGGKLRTVANPNRVLQWCNIPLGEALSRLMKKNTNQFVYDQEEGMLWAQSKLMKREFLSSFDMSSATDRLDYRKWINIRFKNALKDNSEFPLLKRSIEFFCDTSDSPWGIPGHVSDLIDNPSCTVSWTVGQPLGLRPSFPILTLMNCDMAQEAIKQVESEVLGDMCVFTGIDGKIYNPLGSISYDHYACIGDDLIISSKYADAYTRIVRSFNGDINKQKGMESDRYCEFCSHLISATNIYPMKPRFIHSIEGSLMNLEKFSTKGLQPKVPKWAVQLYHSISKYSLKGFNMLPYSVSSTPKSFNERFGVNVLIDMLSSESPERETISLETLFQRYKSNCSRDRLKVRHLGTSYASRSIFDDTTEPIQIHAKYESTELPEFDYLGKVATDGSTSVELPVKTEWDYRSNKYVTSSNPIKHAKALSRTLMSIETDANSHTMSVKLRPKGKGHCYELLIDLESPSRDTLLSLHSNSGDILLTDVERQDKMLARANVDVADLELEDDSLEF